MITILAMITSMEIILLTSMKVNLSTRSEKHCHCLVVKNLRHKHHKDFDVAIVIKVVMIIRQKSNKSEFNNCISTERETDGEFLGLVGLSLKNEAYQYFVAELFWLQVLICITIRLLLNKKKLYVEMC